MKQNKSTDIAHSVIQEEVNDYVKVLREKIEEINSLVEFGKEKGYSVYVNLITPANPYYPIPEIMLGSKTKFTLRASYCFFAEEEDSET